MGNLRLKGMVSNLTKIVIRECLLEELRLVQKIEQEVYKSCINKELFSLLTDAEFVLRIKQPNYIFGCFDYQLLIGYVIYKIPDKYELDEFDITTYGYSQNDTVILDGLAVLPHFRGLGLQKRMLTYFENKARSYLKSNIVATVHPDNVYCLRNFLDAGYSILKEKNMSYGHRYLINKII